MRPTRFSLHAARLDRMCRICFGCAADFRHGCTNLAASAALEQETFGVALHSAPEGEGSSTLLNTYLEKRADLVRFFTLRLGTQAEAEDLVQEIYLKIQSGRDFDDVKSPAAYLYRIGTNLLVDRKRGQIRALRRDTEWHSINTEALGKEYVTADPTGEDSLAAKQRLAKVLTAVGELPPQCQRVFRLHKFDGLSHAQVAEQLGISRSAVEKHVSAALKALTRKLT
jgi:RNA polymerase sigma factor (sigma-70 family)